MTRRYKFRAWYPEEKRMEYQDNKTPAWVGDILTHPAYMPMQFVGISDVNGKEIYEDDIVTHRIYSATTIKSISDFSRMKLDVSRYNWHKHAGYGFEVIGNIHENPELIK